MEESERWFKMSFKKFYIAVILLTSYLHCVISSDGTGEDVFFIVFLARIFYVRRLMLDLMTGLSYFYFKMKLLPIVSCISIIILIFIVYRLL